MLPGFSLPVPAVVGTLALGHVASPPPTQRPVVPPVPIATDPVAPTPREPPTASPDEAPAAKVPAAPMVPPESAGAAPPTTAAPTAPPAASPQALPPAAVEYPRAQPLRRGDDLLRTPSRTGYILFSAGPSVGMIPIFFPIASAQLKQVFGTHQGRPDGLGVGFFLQENLGFDFRLSAGAQMTWDRPIRPGRAIYLAPTFALGVTAGLPLSYSYSVFPAGLDVQAGFEIKTVLNDRLVLSFAPLNVEVGTNFFTLPLVNYTLSISVGASRGRAVSKTGARPVQRGSNDGL